MNNLRSHFVFPVLVIVLLVVLAMIVGIIVFDPSLGQNTTGRNQVASKLQGMGYTVIFATGGSYGCNVVQETDFYSLLNPQIKTIFYAYDGFAYYFWQENGTTCVEMIKF